MTQPTATLETRDGVIRSVESVDGPKRRRRISPITKMLVASVLFAGGYAAFERIGTTANADVVEYTQHLAGGFLAVGMTEDQPGFIVLSKLEQAEVDVSATQTVNRLAGTHTVVDIQTPSGVAHRRLRGPLVILVTEQGDIQEFDIDWTVEEFKAVRAAADCSYEAAAKKHRCGAPFTDLQEAFATWPGARVPDPVRAFLEPYKDRRAHRHRG